MKYCTVVTATNGQQALDLIDNGVRPTVVVCDIMMPGTHRPYTVNVQFILRLSWLYSDGWLWSNECAS